MALDNAHSRAHDPFTDDLDMETGDLRAGADIARSAGSVGTETVTVMETVTTLAQKVV